MNIVITGFKSFLNHQINPSEILVQKISHYYNLQNTKSNDVSNSYFHIHTQVLSVEFSQSFLQLDQLVSNLILNNKKPDFIIMLGLAADRTKICFEKIALNWQQSKNSDEAGYQPSGGPIIQNKELALMSPFSIEEALNHLSQSDLNSTSWPMQTSFSAGTYVCNDLYYRQLQAYPGLNSVFIHIPPFYVISEEYQFQFILELIEYLKSRYIKKVN